jgi:hypothetical protein
VLSACVWTYNPDSDPIWGDGFNREDFSVVSPAVDDADDADFEEFADSDQYAHGRGLDALVRPCFRRCLGRPLHMSFDMLDASKCFIFEFEQTDTEASHRDAPTVLFLPRLHYAVHGTYRITVTISDGTYTLDAEDECLVWRPSHGPSGFVHRIVVQCR